jgi:catechol 2,3-dioxygenase-like lactoylglutathione lyase family enzyme
LIAKGVHHISFAITDLERSRRFYEGVLGLEQIERPDLGAVKGVWYRTGGTEVHLIVPPEGAEVGAAPNKISPVAGHVAFWVDDYGATRDRLRSKGIDVLEAGPRAGQMWVQDPDGNVIELIVRSG